MGKAWAFPKEQRCPSFDSGPLGGGEENGRQSQGETYIGNNREFIPNFGERRRQRKRHSWSRRSNQVVSRRFVKKQQMQWTLRWRPPIPTNRNESSETTSWPRYSGSGIRNSRGRHKRSRKSARRPDARPSDFLVIHAFYLQSPVTESRRRRRTGRTLRRESNVQTCWKPWNFNPAAISNQFCHSAHGRDPVSIPGSVRWL